MRLLRPHSLVFALFVHTSSLIAFAQPAPPPDAPPDAPPRADEPNAETNPPERAPLPPPPPPATLPLPPPPPPPQAQPQSLDQSPPFVVEPIEATTEAPKPSIPLQRRGFVGVDTAVTSSYDERAAFTTDVVASIPATKRAFFEARLPFFGAERQTVMGSPLLGGRYLVHPSKAMWIDVGGDVGLPIATGAGRTLRAYGLARGRWDVQTFFPDTFLLKAHAEFDIATDSILVRFAFAPIITLDVGRDGSDTDGLHLQQAVEIQSRGTVGGGFRLQGVFTPAGRVGNETGFVLSTEPFFYVERKLAFLRFGLLLPFEIGDSPRSFPGRDGLTYALRITTGIRLNQ